MSFSGNVKEELAAYISSARHCQLAELAALLLFSADSCEGNMHLRLDTENEAVVRKCFTLLRKTFNIETVMQGKERLIPDDTLEYKVIQALHFVRTDTEGLKLTDTVNTLLIKNSCCARAYLRGAFLSIAKSSSARSMMWCT